MIFFLNSLFVIHIEYVKKKIEEAYKYNADMRVNTVWDLTQSVYSVNLYKVLH